VGIRLEADEHAGKEDHQRDAQLELGRINDASGERGHGKSPANRPFQAVASIPVWRFLAVDSERKRPDTRRSLNMRGCKSAVRTFEFVR
jgi:hypothetical protein